MRQINLEEILKSKIPKDCIWEDMNNLTNTPINLVVEAMREACNQVVDLCNDNAEIEEYDEHMQYSPRINSELILKTKEQIK